MKTSKVKGKRLRENDDFQTSILEKIKRLPRAIKITYSIIIGIGAIGVLFTVNSKAILTYVADTIRYSNHAYIEPVSGDSYYIEDLWSKEANVITCFRYYRFRCVNGHYNANYSTLFFNVCKECGAAVPKDSFEALWTDFVAEHFTSVKNQFTHNNKKRTIINNEIWFFEEGNSSNGSSEKGQPFYQIAYDDLVDIIVNVSY